MGRPDVNQDLEAIEDAPAPLYFEMSNDENLHESYESHDPTQDDEQEGSLNDYQENQPQQQQQSLPTVPPQIRQQNGSQHPQFPSPNTNNQMRPNPNSNSVPQSNPPPPHGFVPPLPRSQAQPQVFPPSQYNGQQQQPFPQSQSMAFPPRNGSQNAQFPPQNNQNMRPNPNANNVPQAFPPQSPTQPQAFPPPQYNHDQQQQQAFPQSPHKQGASFQAQNAQQQAFPPPKYNQQQQQQQAYYQAQNVQQQAFPPNYNQYQNQGFQQQAAIQQPNNGVQYSNFSQTGNYNSATGIPIGNQNPSILATTEGWSTGLFECMNDPGNAIVTACFPCVTFGQIAEVVDSGTTSCTTSGLMYGVVASFIGLPCIISFSYRSKIRARYGIMEAPAQDWLVHCLFEWCALCQEYRELQLRGLDPSIGWMGNIAKSQQGQMAPMTPPYNQTMMA